MVSGYARNFGPTAIEQFLWYVGFVLLCSAVVTAYTRQWKDALFWAALIALLTFLAIAGGYLTNRTIDIGWGLVGAACGALAGAKVPRNLISGTLVSMVVGPIAMAAIIAAFHESYSNLIMLDVLSAGIVGGLLRPFVEILGWFERNRKAPRAVLAAWLSVSVLVGNMLVPILAGVQR